MAGSSCWTGHGGMASARCNPSSVPLDQGCGHWDRFGLTRQFNSKPGFIRPPAYYGPELAEYQRSGINERDKSWSAQGVDVDGLIDQLAAFDLYVGSMLRLIRAFGLREREAIMFRPNECLVNFADTGLPLAEKQGEDYVWVRQGAKGGRPRFVPMNTPRRCQAVASTQRIAFWDSHAHTGDPDRDLKQNMVRFGYVLRKFGITSKGLGIAAHGLPPTACGTRR